jgi:hypothetical protein
VPIADKVTALLTALTPADVQALPPAQRRRFADLCRHWAALAEQKVPPLKAAFITELEDGRGRE